MSVSVIIPVGPGEQGYFSLLDALCRLPEQWQVIFALCEPENDLALPSGKQFYTVISEPGRAAQMNCAAAVAQGEWLWFLHLDSELNGEMINALQQGIADKPDALHYFRLGFSDDGAGPVALNARAANLRARWLGVPFGDQGLCLRASAFHAIGGYPQGAPYGEDHLLVWHARQFGLRLNCLDAELRTSARKYRQQGWWRLTGLYQWRWIRQALPQILRLLHARLTRLLHR